MIKTNKERLIVTSVSGEIVNPSMMRSFKVDYEGKARSPGFGMSGIKYNVSLGDLCYGWEGTDHLEPGVCVSNKNEHEFPAFSLLACIGNEASLTSGEAKGENGIIVGKHMNFMVHFEKPTREKLTIGDKLQIKAWGVGLKIEGHKNVRPFKIDPNLLEKMDIVDNGDHLEVSVVSEVPAHIMGSGYGFSPYTLDYDIQTACDESNDELNLKKLRMGDIVAIKDQLSWYGYGYYKDAISIGVICHGWSRNLGHGPGVNIILSAKPKNIIPKISNDANLKKYLK
jgi:hypothetical protein